MAAAEIAGDSEIGLTEYNYFAPAKYATVGMEYALKDLPESKVPDISFFKIGRVTKL